MKTRNFLTFLLNICCFRLVLNRFQVRLFPAASKIGMVQSYQFSIVPLLKLYLLEIENVEIWQEIILDLPFGFQ